LGLHRLAAAAEAAVPGTILSMVLQFLPAMKLMCLALVMKGKCLALDTETMGSVVFSFTGTESEYRLGSSSNESSS